MCTQFSVNEGCKGGTHSGKVISGLYFLGLEFSDICVPAEAGGKGDFTTGKPKILLKSKISTKSESLGIS